MKNQETITELTAESINSKKLTNLSFDGLQEKKAQQIKETFVPMTEMLESFESSYNAIIKQSSSEITLDVTKKAKELRLSIAKVRIQTEKLRKAQKEEVIRLGKSIDGVANILKYAVSTKEKNLKEIEDYFAIQEKKRLDELQNERAKRLLEYDENAYERDLLKFENDEFEALLEFKKKEKAEAEKAEAEAEKIRQAQRLKENKLNERLNETRELGEHFDFSKLNLDTSEDEYQELLSTAKSLKKKEQDRIKKAEAENEKLRKKAKQEEAKRKKIEAKIKAEKEAEKKRQQEIEKAKKAKKEEELNKSDEVKINELLSDLDAIALKYKFESEENKDKFRMVKLLINEAISTIKKDSDDK